MEVAADRAALFRALCGFSSEQCEALAIELRLPRERMPPPTAGATDRAAALLRFSEKQPDGLALLARAIRDVADASGGAAQTSNMLRRIVTLPARLLRAARERSFERRYLRLLSSDEGSLGAPGTPAAVSLADVYVAPPLLARPASGGGGAPRDPALAGGPASVEDLLRDSDRATTLLVAGSGGSGRTTLLRHLALSLAAGRAPESRLPELRVPLLLRLPEHAPRIEAGVPSLAMLAQVHFGERGVRPPAGWFERQLAGGHALVLLDGLDEIADAGVRARIGAWIGRQVARYRQCRFVVACGSEEGGAPAVAPLDGARVIEPLAWDADRIRRFAERWYQASASPPGGRRRELPADAAHSLRDLLARLEENAAVASLVSQPQALSLLLMVHRHAGELPETRAQLHRAACDALLDWLDVENAGNLQLPQKSRAMEALARAMMERRISTITGDEACSVVGPALAAAGARGVPAESFLSQVGKGSGLLRERAPGRWSFVHLGLQQYLCAAAWSATGAPDPAPLVGDAWWHQTLCDHASLRDAASVVAACLADGTAPALALAARLAGDARLLPEERKRRVFERVEAEVESADPERRRLAARTRLSRRLAPGGSLVHLDEGQAIDADYLTCAEYQLFLDELGPQAALHRPDHVLGARFPQGAGWLPNLGVRREDAVAFSAWLSRRSTGVRYRLPTAAELARRPSGGRGLVAWTSDGGDLGSLGAIEAAAPGSDADRAFLDEGLEEVMLRVLQAEARFGMAPPSASFLRRELPREIAAGGDEMKRQLQFALVTAARAFDEHCAESDHIGGGPLHTIRDLRRAPVPEAVDRAALLAWLGLAHRALGTDHESLSAGHYLALKQHAHLDYHLLLDVVLAAVIARELPRVAALLSERAPFEADLDLTAAMLRALGFYGQRARQLLERRRLDEAFQELAQQLSKGIPARDHFMYRLAALAATEVELASGQDTPAGRRAFYLLCAQLAAFAFEFARRTGEGDAPLARTFGADGRARRYRQWADGPLADLYFFAQLVLARAEGKLPPWEGIRLVRERA